MPIGWRLWLERIQKVIPWTLSQIRNVLKEQLHCPSVIEFALHLCPYFSIGTAFWLCGRSVSPARLSFASWDDDDLAVAFDKVTGDTHLVASSAIEILRLIEKSPMSSEAIAQELADLFSAEDQAKLPEFISATLLQLRDLGLVTDTPV